MPHASPRSATPHSASLRIAAPRRLLATALAASLALALGACGAGDAGDAAAADAPTGTSAAAPTPEARAEAQRAATQLFADYWEAQLRLNPLRATQVGDARYNDQLPDLFSADYRAEVSASNRQWLARAQALDADALEDDAALSLRILVRGLEREIEGERFPGWMQPLNQFSSFPNQLAQLGSGTGAQPFATAADYAAWRARGARVPVLVDSMIANMREGIAAGVVQPKVLMERVLPQLDALIHDAPEDTLFWRPVATMPEAIGGEDRARIEAEYRGMIADELMPAFRRLREFVATEYLPACRDTHGLADLPDGEAWYAFNAARSTTTAMTPEEIHQVGLAEVARIHGEMRGVMAQVGFAGDLPAFFAYMTTDPRFEFASEQALLDAYNAFGEALEPAITAQFTLLPRAGFEIRPVEAYRAASAAGGSYQRPSEDGTRPGIFYVNTYDLPSRKTWDVASLYLHEAKPGHHFQLALQQELTGLPMFRRFGGEIAFSEGWGLYAESLGDALGAYADPHQKFGALQAELWRAIRLVVDTGLHAKGWTREQVIDYMLANSATTMTEARAEAERYMAIPGQALAYKVGQLRITALRAQAEQALGDRFDAAAFHAEVLRDGSVPLDVLEAKIARWIDATRDTPRDGGGAAATATPTPETAP